MAPVYYSPGPSYAPPQPVAPYGPGPPTLYAVPMGQSPYGRGPSMGGPSVPLDMSGGPRGLSQSGSDGGPPAREGRAKRSYRKKAAPSACAACGTSDTPEWRKGPTGNRTLSVSAAMRSH